LFKLARLLSKETVLVKLREKLIVVDQLKKLIQREPNKYQEQAQFICAIVHEELKQTELSTTFCVSNTCGKIVY